MDVEDDEAGADMEMLPPNDRSLDLAGPERQAPMGEFSLASDPRCCPCRRGGAILVAVGGQSAE
eukprot:1274424-Alexandrium_andersonii.AAC.1